MTSINASSGDVFPASSVRDRARAPRRARAGMLESIGRRLVPAALARMTHGGIRLIDEQGRVAFEPPARTPGETVPTVRVHNPSFYGAVAFGGSDGVADAYLDGAWETDDLAGVIEIATVNMSATDALDGPLVLLLGPLSRVAYWLDRNTRRGSRRNIAAHYDLGNDFFRLFLDGTMTYSCAVFENGATTLEAAQREKIDRACRKLDLRHTDHLLEIGTGWGALAVHAAREYGCRVTTTTISQEQHRRATALARESGVADLVSVRMTDYRDLRGSFDKLVSIEMLEAVGAKNLGTYFETVARLLQPEGAALIQSIVIRDQFFAAAAKRQDFLKRFIFPGSCLPSVAAIIGSVAGRTDMRLWHLEDIGPHYATTLRLWRDAFMSRLDEVRAMGFDDRFMRMWEYYLAYCEGAFRARHVGDVQVLLTKPMCRIAPIGASRPGGGP